MPPGIKYENIDDELGDILKKEFVNQFRTGYILSEGHVLPENYKRFGESIKKMNVRKDDVWVCSFPKCGTTWTQEMCWLIANDLDYKGAELILSERFPFLEHTALFDYREMFAKNPDFSTPPYVSDSVGFIDRTQGRRFIKTHLPYDLLPEQILKNTEYPKIIYVYRNPKDCLISYYHHCILMEGYEGGFDNFFKLFMGGRLSFSPFWPHVLNFYDRREQNNILFLKYEDMKADLMGVVRKVISFLGKRYSEDELGKLCQHLSFESMKMNPAVNYEPVIEFNKKHGLITAEGNFMRAGKVGDFKGKMTQEQIDIIDRWSRTFIKDRDIQP